jgi:prepilin-type N-terminal cleavage/methylation domain-containing protein
MKNKIKNSLLCSKNQNGFSLIEMVAAITLLGIMGIFSTQFITGITQSAQLTTGQKGLVDDAKLAMEYLIREARVADESNNSIAVTSTASAALLTFDKFNGYTVDTNNVSIKYDWNSTSKALTRTSGAVITTLATQISSFTIVESPSAGSGFFIFTLVLQGPNGENFTLESGVRPRGSI